MGIGDDKYRYRTLPLFLDGRWNFGEEKQRVFYGDFGYSFAMKNKPGKEVIIIMNIISQEGIYTDAGIGFYFPLYKKSSLLFSLGYSYKRIKNETGVNICPYAGRCYVDYSPYDLRFGRLTVKAGLIL